MSQLVDTYMAYRFVKILTTPWKKQPAYKMGLVDEKGKKLKSPKTDEEKNAYTYFDRLVFNIKRLIQKAPGGKSQIASYGTALLLLKERYGDQLEDIDMFDKLLADYLAEEEGPTNVASQTNKKDMPLGKVRRRVKTCTCKDDDCMCPKKKNEEADMEDKDKLEEQEPFAFESSLFSLISEADVNINVDADDDSDDEDDIEQKKMDKKSDKEDDKEDDEEDDSDDDEESAEGDEDDDKEEIDGSGEKDDIKVNKGKSNEEREICLRKESIRNKLRKHLGQDVVEEGCGSKKDMDEEDEEELDEAGKIFKKVVRNKKVIRKAFCPDENKRLKDGKCVNKDSKFKRIQKKSKKKMRRTKRGKSLKRALMKRAISLKKLVRKK